MGKVEEALRAEISRLVRRELSAVVAPLSKEVRLLKREVAQLGKAAARPAARPEPVRVALRGRKAKAAPPQAAAPETEKARLSPRLIQSLRNRLGLTQAQLGALTGVTPGAVTQWEKGVISPRGEKRAALIALRRVGRRDVKRMLEERGISPGRKRRPRAA